MLTFIFSTIFALSSFAQTAEPHPVKNWTVLVYWAVDNDLYEFSKPYLHQFEQVGSDSNINIIVQYDYPKGRNTERYYIEKSSRDLQPGEDLISSTSVQVLPTNTNSADPKVLADFIDWGMKTYPSLHTALIIGSHGSNWSGTIEDEPAVDYMSLSEFRQALPVAPKPALDLLLFDTCKMSFLETLYMLHDTATLMVGSTFDLNGFDHVTPLKLLAQNPNMPLRDLASAYVDAYPLKPENLHDNEMAASALSLYAIDTLTDAFQDFISELNQQQTAELQNLISSLSQTVNEDGDVALDLYELVEKGGHLSDELFARSQAMLFVKDSYVKHVAATPESGNPSGLSVTCAKAADVYQKIGFGAASPEWVQFCKSVPTRHSL